MQHRQHSQYTWWYFQTTSNSPEKLSCCSRAHWTTSCCCCEETWSQARHKGRKAKCRLCTGMVDKSVVHFSDWKVSNNEPFCEEMTTFRDVGDENDIANNSPISRGIVPDATSPRKMGEKNGLKGSSCASAVWNYILLYLMKICYLTECCHFKWPFQTLSNGSMELISRLTFLNQLFSDLSLRNTSLRQTATSDGWNW